VFAERKRLSNPVCAHVLRGDFFEKMQHQMEDLLRRLSGRKSEELDPNELLLEEPILSAEGEGHRPEQPEPAGEIPAPPAHLPRKEITIPVPEADRISPVRGPVRSPVHLLVEPILHSSV
jgi:hypothetical protein